MNTTLPLLHMRRSASVSYAKWAAGLFLILVLALMCLEFYRSYFQSELNAQHQASTLSKLLSERLAAELREASLVLDSLNDNNLVLRLLETGNVSSVDNYRLIALLDQKIQGAPYLTEIQILDTSCRVLSSNRSQANTSHSRAPYCHWLHRNSARKEPTFTSIQSNLTSTGIIQARRLYDEHGKLLGIAIAFIAPEFLVGEVTAGQHGEIMMMDQHQTLIARWPKTATVQLASFADPSQLEKVFRREKGHLLFYGSSAIDGIGRIYSLRSAAHYPLQVAIGIATSHFTSALKEKVIIYLLAWWWLFIITLLALRNYLANLSQNALLLINTQKIKASEEQARLTLDAAPVALMLVDTVNQVIFYANALARVMLYLPEHMDGAPPESAHLALPLRLKPINDWLLAGENVQAKEVEIEREDGSRLWVVVTMQPTHFRDRPATLIGLYDISERKRLEQEIERKNSLLSELAVTDPLTHLYNRRFADQTIKDEILRCERYGLPMTIASVDIDHFKQFNDRYGHQAGDSILSTVANEMRELTRSTDICTRVGGEEFLVIFPCTRLKDAYKVIERIRNKIEKTTFPFAQENVTFSGGITGWQPGDTATTMQARVDKLLYQAKMNGRNRLVVDEEAH